MKPVIELRKNTSMPEHYTLVLYKLINLQIIIKVFFDILTIPTYLKKKGKKPLGLLDIKELIGIPTKFKYVQS